MVKLSFQHHYSKLQCHMILQKSFLCTDLVLKKLLSLHFKTVVLLNIFCGNLHFFQDSLMDDIIFVSFSLSHSFSQCGPVYNTMMISQPANASVVQIPSNLAPKINQGNAINRYMFFLISLSQDTFYKYYQCYLINHAIISFFVLLHHFQVSCRAAVGH